VPVSPLDKQLGIEVYATKSLGVGGTIRETVDDFVVEEMLVDSSKASIKETVSRKVLGSSSERQRFLLCVLVKRNWDTFIAIKNIAKQLGIDQRRIQIAGIKDAKAATAQHLTIENCLSEDASKVNVKDVKLYPMGYLREALSLYYLLGNYFTIKIKSIMLDEDIVKTRISQTQKQLESIGGIPNFFGHQRFGTTRPITHLVGKALVRGDLKEAAMIFLAKPSINEHPSSRQARQQLEETGDFREALQNFPKQLRFERIMLSHLADNPNDFLGAFRQLPPKLQELFVQAHQSYLFNRFLSERIKEGYFLNKAEVGDYVIGVERSGLPVTKVAKMAISETLAEINEKVKSGKMRVALPIVGMKQKLSKGVMGDMEKKVLDEEEINLESSQVNELSIGCGKGGLRTAITLIKDFKVENVSTDNSNGGCQTELNFMLLRGSYATVLLREIMKPTDLIGAGF
jgi:tRNA pseudouridine13 synthase